MIQFMRKFGVFDLSSTVLGRGSYSCVLLGRDSSLDEHVAVKVVNREPLLSNLAARQRLGREVTLIQNLKHRCICECRGVFRSQSRFYLVFELCRGGDLHAYVHAARGAVPLPDAMSIFADLLLAIDYIHANYVAHRDIKLENVLINDVGEAKLCDFGFATVYRPSHVQTLPTEQQAPVPSTWGDAAMFPSGDAPLRAAMAPTPDVAPGHAPLPATADAHILNTGAIGASTHLVDPETEARYVWNTPTPPEEFAFLMRDEATTRCGSPHYAAPELFHLTTTSYNPYAADMWSAGVLCYGLVCGTLPFDVRRTENRQEMREQLRQAVCRGTYWQPNAPDDVVDLIRRLLVIDPPTRLTAREALFHPAVLPYVRARVARYGVLPPRLSRRQASLLADGPTQVPAHMGRVGGVFGTGPPVGPAQSAQTGGIPPVVDPVPQDRTAALGREVTLPDPASVRPDPPAPVYGHDPSSHAPHHNQALTHSSVPANPILYGHGTPVAAPAAAIRSPPRAGDISVEQPASVLP